MKTVLIDCGHFDKQNRSPVVPNYYEGNQMWALGQQLAQELVRRGVSVKQTRTDIKKPLAPDTHNDVRLRGEKATDCDLFVSLHSNASTSDKTRRVVVIHYLDADTADKQFAQCLGDTVKRCMDITEPTQLYTRSLPDNKSREYYGILRAAKETAKCKHSFIIEHSFHTNAETCRFLLDKSNLQKLATAEAEAICNYLGIAKTSAQTVKASTANETSCIGICVGDTVRIKAGAKYKGGRAVPGIIRAGTYTVDKIDGDYVRLKEIFSWVDISGLKNM